MSSVIAVDIGGTTIKAGRISSGSVIEREEIPSEAPSGRYGVITRIIKSIDILMARDVRGIALCIPGTIDAARGTVLCTSNLPLSGVAIARIIEKRFNTSVVIENDANCFALGEALYGSGRGHKTVFGITIGTGLGSGIVIEKRLFHGRMNAGELSTICINVQGLRCSCRGRGCAEEYVSARALMRYAQGVRATSPEEVYLLACKGNRRAQQAFATMGMYLGIACTNVISLLDPDIIVIGGKISQAWRYFAPAMRKTIAQHCMVNAHPRILKSRLTDAALLGAASLIER